MNYDRLDYLMNEIIKEVRITRFKYLYDSIKHDSQIKQYLGVKKLRKNPLLKYFPNGILVGKGNLQVTSTEQMQEVINKIKQRLR